MSAGCLCFQLQRSSAARTHLDPCGGSCRRESDELTCQGIVWDKKQWNNQNYREIALRMSSTWLFGFKERERNWREEPFKCLLLRPATSSPSVCFMILFCTSGWWKNQTGHTAPLLTFLDVCSNTQPAPSLSAAKKEKKTPHQQSVTIRGTWQAAGAEQEAREELKHHSLGRGWSLEKSRDSVFTTSPILEAWTKHAWIGIIWSLGDCVLQLFLAGFL